MNTNNVTSPSNTSNAFNAYTPVENEDFLKAFEIFKLPLYYRNEIKLTKKIPKKNDLNTFLLTSLVVNEAKQIEILTKCYKQLKTSNNPRMISYVCVLLGILYLKAGKNYFNDGVKILENCLSKFYYKEDSEISVYVLSMLFSFTGDYYYYFESLFKFGYATRASLNCGENIPNLRSIMVPTHLLKQEDDFAFMEISSFADILPNEVKQNVQENKWIKLKQLESIRVMNIDLQVPKLRRNSIAISQEILNKFEIKVSPDLHFVEKDVEVELYFGNEFINTEILLEFNNGTIKLLENETYQNYCRTILNSCPFKFKVNTKESKAMLNVLAGSSSQIYHFNFLHPFELTLLEIRKLNSENCIKSGIDFGLKPTDFTKTISGNDKVSIFYRFGNNHELTVKKISLYQANNVSLVNYYIDKGILFLDFECLANTTTDYGNLRILYNRNDNEEFSYTIQLPKNMASTFVSFTALNPPSEINSYEPCALTYSLRNSHPFKTFSVKLTLTGNDAFVVSGYKIITILLLPASTVPIDLVVVSVGNRGRVLLPKFTIEIDGTKLEEEETRFVFIK